MTDMITTSGLVATEPEVFITGEKLMITSFRLAAGQRKFNRTTKVWEYSETNWYKVTAFRRLAENTKNCVRKGDRVVVSGRLRIRKWETDDRSGIAVEIDAELLGHDLNWGTTSYAKTVRPQAAVDATGPSEDDATPDPVDEPADASGESAGSEPAWVSEEQAPALIPF